MNIYIEISQVELDGIVPTDSKQETIGQDLTNELTALLNDQTRPIVIDANPTITNRETIKTRSLEHRSPGQQLAHEIHATYSTSGNVTTP